MAKAMVGSSAISSSENKSGINQNKIESDAQKPKNEEGGSQI